jgi:pimeloyl-ACP methyl ester carboxylesterase
MLSARGFVDKRAEAVGMEQQAILLPGAVLPSDLAYGDLIAALGDGVAVRAKDLEVYAGDEPPADYGLETEIEGVLAEAAAAGFERFHLVGYSGGGAISAAFVGRYPERVLSLALLEPAWIGNQGLTASEREAWSELDRIGELPPEEMMARFVRAQLAPGVEPPAPPPGPSPPWMAKRPAGLRAFIGAVRRYDLEPAALSAFERPVYFALGALSNPGYYGVMAQRAQQLFGDCTLEVFEGRHHFDPPHRIEPERLALRLRELWDRAAGAESDGRKSP